MIHLEVVSNQIASEPLQSPAQSQRQAPVHLSLGVGATNVLARMKYLLIFGESICGGPLKVIHRH